VGAAPYCCRSNNLRRPHGPDQRIRHTVTPLGNGSNGSSALTQFPESITPNLHRLWRQFNALRTIEDLLGTEHINLKTAFQRPMSLRGSSTWWSGAA
jgi:hypothetical protein